MEQTELFSKNKLVRLILPLVMEQLLSVTVGMADMIMVAGAGEAAVSGISLVNTISNLLIMMFTALATGGAVASAQFLGNKDKKSACASADQLILICGIFSVFLCMLFVFANHQILTLIYGSVDKSVMDSAIIYFYITAFSFPFLAVYNACAGIFRSMGNSYISMWVAFVMNILHIIGNAVLVYSFHMGVAGVGYSTLFSRAIACLTIVFWLKSPKHIIHLSKPFPFRLDLKMIHKILHVGVPNAMENSMFQIGKLLTQSLISSFGTASIAANACASTVETLSYIPASAIGIALITVVGQCVGAGDYVQARSYTKKLMKYSYLFLFLLNTTIIVFAPIIASWYQLTETGNQLAIELIRYDNLCCMLIWPLAFTLPSVLRAAGDAKFTMTVSIFSMWIFRIGLAYMIGDYMKAGVLGVWVAMTIDWAIRSIFNIIRFHGKKWEKKALVSQ